MTTPVGPVASAPTVERELTNRVWACFTGEPCQLGARINLSGTESTDGNVQYEVNGGPVNVGGADVTRTFYYYDNSRVGTTYDARARRKFATGNTNWGPWSRTVRFRPFPTDSEMTSLPSSTAVRNFVATREGTNTWRFRFDHPTWNGGLPIEKFEWGWLDRSHRGCTGFLFGARPIHINEERDSYDFDDNTMAHTVDGVANPTSDSKGRR